MPNRVLRDWTTSEAIDKLSVHAEVFFTRLIMKADDYGNYTANPKLLKAALFPLRDCLAHEVNKWIEECVRLGIIKKYTVEGKDYLNIPNFGQRLRAMKSQYPAIGQTNDGHMSDNGRPETKRNEVETESETETNSVNFDDLFIRAFDEITCSGYAIAFKNIDLGAELQKFRIKCDNDKPKYYGRDVGGLRTAFQYQLQNIRTNGKRKSGTLQDGENEIREILNREFGNQ